MTGFIQLLRITFDKDFKMGRASMNQMVFFVCFIGTVLGISIPGYYQWSPSTGQRLFCPTFCQAREEPDRCCACEASPCWNIAQNVSQVCGTSISNLELEYVNNLGEAVLIAPVIADIYRLISTHGSLTKVPRNICSFSNSLVEIDLSYNKLKTIELLKCLQAIDTLHLDNNLIDHVDNQTFTNMSTLRLLTLTNNRLDNLEPNVLKIGDHNIMLVDLSLNYMETVDVTNLFRPGVFCNISVQNSSTETLTNELGYVLDKNNTCGPGDVLLEHSSISHLPNFTDMGVDFKELPLYFKGRIRIGSSSLRCDCNLYPFLTSLGTEAGKYWPNVDHQTFICNSPEHMKGVNVTDIIAKSQYDKLVCELENCPSFRRNRCHCLDMPHDNKILVNCTAVGFQEFPEEMPFGFWNNVNIDLLLVDNNIKKMTDRNYYNRLVSLDLSGNFIEHTSSSAVEKIHVKCPINMSDQRLETLVSKFENKNPLMINFGEHPIRCDCSNLWIGDWIRVNNGHDRLRCAVKERGVISAEKVTASLLDCEKKQIDPALIAAPSIAVITLIILISGLCFIFKYDIMITMRRFKIKNSSGVFMHDVFISFCEDNEDAFFLVQKYLRQGLEQAGYTCFTPWFDIPSGERDNTCTEAIENSQNYVVVLTNDYLEDFNTFFEFDRIWKNFRTNILKRIIIINLDNMNANKMNDKRLNAIQRTTPDISFKDRHTTLLDRLKVRLGSPASRPESNTINDPTNDKLKLEPHIQGTLSKSNNSRNLQLEFDLKYQEYFRKPVHERLNLRKSECNCQFRKCYLHSEDLKKYKT